MSKQDFSSMRAAMVASQLRTNSVSNPVIVAAMEAVAREDFVPVDRAALAYIDVPVPLRDGRSLNAPLVTGRLLVESGVKAGDKVLLIGAATGYSAALLAEIGAEVVAVEENSALTAEARRLLSGRSQISLIESPLVEGALDQSPFDVVIIDGAVGHVPQVLWDQLREGGVLATALNDRGIIRLAVGHKVSGSGALIPFVEAEAAVLPGFDTPVGFSF